MPDRGNCILPRKRKKNTLTNLSFPSFQMRTRGSSSPRSVRRQRQGDGVHRLTVREKRRREGSVQVRDVRRAQNRGPGVKHARRQQGHLRDLLLS